MVKVQKKNPKLFSTMIKVNLCIIYIKASTCYIEVDTHYENLMNYFTFGLNSLLDTSVSSNEDINKFPNNF